MKWRAELRERELERMSLLEREWRRREAARTAELAHLKKHYSSLDSTRQVGCGHGSPAVVCAVFVTC